MTRLTKSARAGSLNVRQYLLLTTPLTMRVLITLLIIDAALYALGALTAMAEPWLERWPRLKASMLTLGTAATNFALGLMGLIVVVITLRALGILPLDRS